MPSPDYELFAACAPGLEEVLSRELEALGIARRHVVPGGVEWRGSLAEAARANLWLRTATRILLRIGAFDAPGRRELAARAARLPIDAFARPDDALLIHATSAKSRLYHTGLIREVVHAALARPAATEDSAGLHLFVRFERDRCTFSVDTSGVMLHKRGYREETARAPMRETLAAGLLLLCGYDGTEAFTDPMCGSGTIAIEAAWIATRRAPGLERTFAFESFPSFDAAVLTALKQEARSRIAPARAAIEASDIHAGALGAAKRNSEKAGTAFVRFDRVDAAVRGAPAEHGLLVTNPPYGRRVGSGEELGALERALGGAFAGWRAGILLPRTTRWRVPRRIVRQHRLENGGIPVTLFDLAAS
jgi:putative N6-adenine-specific DNA methylase